MGAAIFQNDTERILFSRTVQSSDWPHMLCWASTEWLSTIANPHFLADTTVRRGDETRKRVRLEELYDILLKDGMRDPLVIAFGRRTKRFRLDEGNQRIRILLQHGIPRVPVIGLVDDTHIMHPANGMHNGLLWDSFDESVEGGFVYADTLLPNEPVARLST